MPAEPGLSVADRLFRVLESCASTAGSLTLADLVERTGLPKTTLHRTCWKLVELGMLEAGPEGFRVGTKVFALGCMNPELRRLRVYGMPYMHELVCVTGRVANLAVLSGRSALLVDEVFGAIAPTMPKMMGARMPLHATAIGKALLLGRSDEFLDDVIGTATLKPFTQHTLVRQTLFREHLDRAAEARVAFSRHEWRLGTSGVAAPVVVDGDTVAAIALIGLSSDADMAASARPLSIAAERLGEVLADKPTHIVNA